MELRLENIKKINLDAPLVVGVFEDAQKLGFSFVSGLDQNDTAYLKKFWSGLNRENGQVHKALLPSGAEILFFGLGKKSAWNTRKYILFVRSIVQSLKAFRISTAGILLEKNLFPSRSQLQDTVYITSQNLLLADFQFNQYKEKPEKGWPEINELVLYIPSTTQTLRRALDHGTAVGEETNNTRALVNTPGGDITPKKLADAAVATGKRCGFSVEVFDEKKIRSLKMGGVLGVSQGSKEKPQFIVMKHRYKTNQKKKPLVLVGKGVTFDTGGLNIKTGNYMYEMHMDMSGGAAVIGAMGAIARLKLPVSIVALVPAVENMPSGESYRPGDILKTFSGKTVEVINTDAEGRLILADALGYAVKHLNPALIVDVATLTGAAAVALGQRVAGLFTNQDRLEKKLRDIGEVSGDYVWPLPVWDEYFEDIKGVFGDIQNSAKTGYGGAITAALFLKQFVDDTPWVHLDIAPVMTTLDEQKLAKGAAGAGVRYLVELTKQFKALKL